MPVVLAFTSGDTINIIKKDRKLKNTVHFIQMPFSAWQISEKQGEVLVN